jgi:polyferredoxin
LGYPVKVFLVGDPLMMITTLLSSRSFFAPLFLALAVVVVTVILGRVFCGWICLSGTLHQLAALLNQKKPFLSRAKKGKTGGSLYRVKYCLLMALLASSLFGLQWVGVFDPLSLYVLCPWPFIP